MDRKEGRGIAAIQSFTIQLQLGMRSEVQQNKKREEACASSPV
jgi:hypothetical protein